MTSTQTAPGPRRGAGVQMQLEGGRKYTLRVEYRQTAPGGSATRLDSAGRRCPRRGRDAWKDSDVAIVFVGLNSELEGEEMRG